MKNDQVEEKFPLLLLYVEENGKKSEFPQRVVFADKGRGKGVIKGAATIITQWPAQVTSCWFTSIAIGFTFILLTFVIFMATLSPLLNPIHPRCTRDLKNYHGNKIIHVVKQGIEWNAQQLDILKFIADTFPKFEINNIIVDISKRNFIKQGIKNTSVSPATTSPATTITTSASIAIHQKNGFLFPDITSIFFRKFNEIIARDREIFNRENNIRNKRKDVFLIPGNENDVPKFSFLNLSMPFLKRTKRSHEQITYSGLLNTNKNIKVKNVTYKEYFVHTPLAYYWPDLNADMIIFAIRVQELWQNGGISFLLPKNEIEGNTPGDKLDLVGLKAVIANTKYKYEVLPNESVSVDGQGLHMATRTPCHTFFGEMLMRMQKDTDKLTVNSFFANTLSVFCRRGAIYSDYCKKTLIK